MKPNGLTAGLQVVRPTPAQDAIWAAVEKCIEEGVSPENFLREAAEAWEERLRDEVKQAGKVLRRGLRL